MLNEEEYASSTDDSDEDYNPEGNNSDVASEVDTDDETENNDENNKSGKQKRKGLSPGTVAKKAKLQAAESNQTQKRANDKKSSPVATLSDDDEDSNEDALWSSFLGKTENGATRSATVTSKKIQAPAKSTTASAPLKAAPQKPLISTATNIPAKPIIVTEIFEFAGEKVEVQKEIKTDKPVALAAGVSATSAPLNKSRIGSSGSGSGGGIASVLGQIGKKNKLSVLQKTQIDWSGFKNKEGIDEELQTFNKGRDGYLERQDFLERTDQRQFEREKNMRQTTRRK